MNSTKNHSVPACPYVGLQPYSEAEREYFFGREQDTETIAANLLTARLTLLYGASGVGKTSVLAAGVVPSLGAIPDVFVFLAHAAHETQRTLPIILNQFEKYFFYHPNSNPFDEQTETKP